MLVRVLALVSKYNSADISLEMNYRSWSIVSVSELKYKEKQRLQGFAVSTHRPSRSLSPIQLFEKYFEPVTKLLHGKHKNLFFIHGFMLYFHSIPMDYTENKSAKHWDEMKLMRFVFRPLPLEPNYCCLQAPDFVTYREQERAWVTQCPAELPAFWVGNCKATCER